MRRERGRGLRKDKTKKETKIEKEGGYELVLKEEKPSGKGTEGRSMGYERVVKRREQREGKERRKVGVKE